MRSAERGVSKHMTDSTVRDEAVVELMVIDLLLDDNQTVEAADSYERWVRKWEGRIVDIGGSAHLRLHPRAYRRRQRRHR